MPLLDPIALGNAAAGNALGTFVLGKYGASEVKGLTDLATDLPLIPQGLVTAPELGALTAELENYKAAVSVVAGATPSAPVTPQTTAQQLLDQLISLIALVSNAMPSATGGIETADQALVSVYLAQWAAGLHNALGFYAGKNSGGTQSATPVPAASTGK